MCFGASGAELNELSSLPRTRFASQIIALRLNVVVGDRVRRVYAYNRGTGGLLMTRHTRLLVTEIAINPVPSLSFCGYHRNMNKKLSALLCILSAFAAQVGSAEEPVRPNILFIAIDDLNDWVGCLGGHPQALTPNIDRLAKQGTLFRNASCQAPICGPSRISLLSGRYPHETGCYHQPTNAVAGDKQLVRDFLPLYFSKHGYKTLSTGKISHGVPEKDIFQITGIKGSSGPKPKKQKRFHYTPPATSFSGTQTDWGVFPEDETQMPDYQSASWAMERLDESHQSPFFLAVGFVRPHVPFYTQKKWFDRFPLDSLVLPKIPLDDLKDIPLTGRAVNHAANYPAPDWLRADNNRQLKLCVQAYLACVAFVDHQVGRVLNALNESRYADNTVVVLFSDHGYHLGEKEVVAKHTTWEESARVPLIVSVPGSEQTTTVDKSVGLIDIYPTLVELAGLPAQGQNSGASLVPLLSNPKADWRDGTLLAWGRGNFSYRTQRYRYIQYADGSEELYDHHSDPHEWNNLVGVSKHHAKIKNFRRQIPTNRKPLHPATSGKPHNAWFQNYLRENGIPR